MQEGMEFLMGSSPALPQRRTRARKAASGR